MRKEFVWALLGALILGTIVAYSYLPASIPVHWNVRGDIDSWGGREMIFLIPGLCVAILVLFKVFAKMEGVHEKNLEAMEGDINFLAFMLIGFFTILQGYLVAAAMGYRNVNIGVIMGMAMGLLFIGIGVFLRRAKKNFFFGVRTPWTLSSERVWRKTHKITGAIFIVLGMALIVASVFITPTNTFLLVLAGAIGATIFAFLYSYFEYRKEKKEVPKPAEKGQKGFSGRKAGKKRRR